MQYDVLTDIQSFLDDEPNSVSVRSQDQYIPQRSAEASFLHRTAGPGYASRVPGLDDFDRALLSDTWPSQYTITSRNSRSGHFRGETSTSTLPSRLFASSQPQAPPPRRKLSSGLSKFSYKPRGNSTPKLSDSDSSPIAQLSSPTPLGSQAVGHVDLFKTPERAFRRTKIAAKLKTNSPTKPTPERRLDNLFEPQEVVKPKPSVPTVNGITLVPTNRLPDRFRSVFAFPLFNAVQSRCFDSVYNSKDNLVVSAPTGSGKTAIMELAICALFRDLQQGTYKVVYQAPTKSLCGERRRDWEKKFSSLGLVCTELTGDTDQAQLSSVRSGDIIVTTPEKWDSMTRRWQDHRKLLDMVRLFLIDEVHILKDSRGATLEVVVSRMRSIGSDVRFVALSATVPNSGDICSWLGKNHQSPDIPATREVFGPEFRPVQLQKYVYGFPNSGNNFQFDKVLDKSLPDLILKHSDGKPVMIFCMTRAICISTAKLLAEKWRGWDNQQRPWRAPHKTFSFKDKDAQSAAECGVAFHNAGLDAADRNLVETLYLEGELNVICCTSTLAVGINLPAHLVIIKNTVCWSDGGAKEYVDLEIMQMLGRAGRPQFGETGVAVIMTAREKKMRYENMNEGAETLESSLHENLVEHMNAEIGLGTITSMETATQWLRSTFLYVRMKKNPHFYKLQGQTLSKNSEQRLDDISERDIDLLTTEGMVINKVGALSHTKFGQAMARYYVKLGTMKTIMNMPPKATLLDVLNIVSEAEEFKELRFRSGEKGLYKELNKDNAIKYPIKEDIGTPAHKVALLIQFELGMLDYPSDQAFQKVRTNMMQDKTVVFKHCFRLLRCLVDCQQELQDATSVLSALKLARCIQGKVWEATANELRQLENIGPASVRKFVNAGVRSISELVTLQPHQIETTISRNPPFGTNLLKAAKLIPQFKLSSRQTGAPKKVGPSSHVEVKIQSHVGLKNEGQILRRYHGTELTAVFVAERSDGLLVDLQRLSIHNLEGGATFKFTLRLEASNQRLRCHIACEQIAGTWETSELKLDVDALLFSRPTRPVQTKQEPNVAAAYLGPTLDKAASTDEDYGDSDIFNDIDIDLEFRHIDEFTRQPGRTSHVRELRQTASAMAQPQQEPVESVQEEPVQLPNGKWECRHKCSDKTKCKHLCCREGLDKQPKPQKRRYSTLAQGVECATTKSNDEPLKPVKGGGKMDLDRMTATLKASFPLGRNSYKIPSLEETLRKGHIDVIDLVNVDPPDNLAKLRQLHDKNTSGAKVKRLPKREPKYSYSGASSHPYPSFTPVNSTLWGDQNEDEGLDLSLPVRLPKKAERPKSLKDWGIETTSKESQTGFLDGGKAKEKRKWLEVGETETMPLKGKETLEALGPALPLSPFTPYRPSKRTRVSPEPGSKMGDDNVETHVTQSPLFLGDPSSNSSIFASSPPPPCHKGSLGKQDSMGGQFDFEPGVYQNLSDQLDIELLSHEVENVEEGELESVQQNAGPLDRSDIFEVLEFLGDCVEYREDSQM